MKSGVWTLDHDTGYRNIKKDLIKRYGKETVQRIWAKAAFTVLLKAFLNQSF